MFYRLSADLISTVHLALMLFLIFGQLAILVGIVLRWRWIRNPWFRWIHMAIILIVAAEAVLKINCPLTDWETDLRRKGQAFTDDAWYIGAATKRVAAQELALLASPHSAVAAGVATTVVQVAEATLRAADERSFTERVVGKLLFPDVPMSFLFACYIGFAVTVLLTFVVAPPWIRAPRGRMVLKLGCAKGGNGGLTSSHQEARGRYAEVAVDRPSGGACTKTVVCPVCEQPVGIAVRSRRLFALRAVLLALLGATLACTGVYWKSLGLPAIPQVWQNTVTVVGLVVFVLAPSGLLIRKALMTADPSAASPDGQHRLFA
jgi:hypothetical protein